MEFNGAVLVSNHKIENALNNYTSLKREYEKEIKRCEDKLASQISHLSWWDTFMCDEGDKDWFKVYKRKYKGKYLRFWRNAWLENFRSVGLVTIEEHKDYEYIDCNLPYYDRYTRELKSLVQAGEPVYLSPEQASFVNRFYVGEY